MAAMESLEFTLLEFGAVGGEAGCEVHVVGDHPALGCWSPAQSVPLRTVTRARLSERVYIAGDHRDTASIQGALVSGDRVARALIAGAPS